MDHLGIEKFMVLGYCIGGPFIWNLLKRAPNRVVAGVLTQPSGHRPELPDQFFTNNMNAWGPALVARRPEITMAMVEAFLAKMYRANPDFVFTVTRDFVRACPTPLLILPDDIPPHPYAVAMESAMLAPNAQVSLYPWKDTKDKIPLAVRLSNSGIFAHSAPWSVADQGVRNVSHGCINLPPDDAQWFYDTFGYGDIVTVTGTSTQLAPDDGYGDWNIPWEKWLQGSALN